MGQTHRGPAFAFGWPVGTLVLALAASPACTSLEPFSESADPFGERFDGPLRLAALSDPDALDDDPTLSDDELTILFNSNRPSGSPAHLFLAQRASTDAPFGPPRLIDELTSAGGETTPEWFAPGQTLYFAADLPGGLGGFDIWGSVRGQDSSFEAPSPAFGLNGPAKDDGPAFSRDGLEVVLASDRNGVQDLFRAVRASVEDAWSVPAPMEGFAGLGFKGGPSFSADGLVLYFHASTVDAPTELDIYRAYRSAPLARFEIVERADSLSSPAVDVDPHLTIDGRAIYLSSDREGSFDLYVAHR